MPLPKEESTDDDVRPVPFLVLSKLHSFCRIEPRSSFLFSHCCQAVKIGGREQYAVANLILGCCSASEGQLRRTGPFHFHLQFYSNCYFQTWLHPHFILGTFWELFERQCHPRFALVASIFMQADAILFRHDCLFHKMGMRPFALESDELRDVSHVANFDLGTTD